MLNIKQMRNIINKQRSDTENERRHFDQFRRWYNSEYWGVDEVRPQGAGDDHISDVTMETNFAYAYVDTLVASVCPNNPQVNVHARRAVNKGVAKIREALANEALFRAKAHRIIWNMSTKASVYHRSWLKATWRKDRQQVQYTVIDPRVIWFDREAVCLEDMRYLIHAVVMTADEFQAKIVTETNGDGYDPVIAEKVKAAAFPQWMRETAATQYVDQSAEASRAAFEWVLVYEFYDFTGEGQFVALADNCEEPLMVAPLPYRTIKNNFYLLTFNENLRNIGGLSDIKLIVPQQKALNEIQTLKLWHALASIPTLLVQAGLIDNPEDFLSALANISGPGQMIMVHGRERVSLRDLIAQTPSPTLTPDWAAAEETARSAIEMILGLPRYARGEVGVVDVATEAALADTAVRTRNSRRQKAVYDMIAWMAETAIAIYTDQLPEDSEIPVRLSDEPDIQVITKQSAALDVAKARAGEDMMNYDYETRPFNAPENNRIAMLKMLRDNWDALTQGIQSGAIDATKLLRRLTELMAIGDVLTDQQANPAPFGPAKITPEGDYAAEGLNNGGELPPTEEGPQVNGGQTISESPQNPGLAGSLAAGTSTITRGTTGF